MYGVGPVGWDTRLEIQVCNQVWNMMQPLTGTMSPIPSTEMFLEGKFLFSLTFYPSSALLSLFLPASGQRLKIGFESLNIQNSAGTRMELVM